MQVALVLSRSVGPTATFVPKKAIETPTSSNPSASLSDSFKPKIQTSTSLEDQSKSKIQSLLINSARGGAISINGNEVKGALIFIVLDYLFRKLFVTYGINFPSQLGGCCILLITMLLAEVVSPGIGDGIFALLTPGANMLAKWLPVFFVPGLAMLPLAPSMGSPLEVSVF